MSKYQHAKDAPFATDEIIEARLLYMHREANHGFKLIYTANK